MNNNIYAYTEFIYKSYPAYLSLNERDGKYYMTVRSRESMYCQEIEIPFMEMLKLGSACMGILNLTED